MTVSVVSVSARGKDEVSVSFEIRQGEAVQRESFLIGAAALADMYIAVGECSRETFDAVSLAAEQYAALKAGLSMLSYGAYSRKALCRKLNSFVSINNIGITDTFKTDLHYLLESMHFRRYSVHVFVIIYLLLAPFFVNRVFDYRKGYVRLQGKKPAVGIVKGYDVVAYKIIFIASVKVILLEFTHFKRKISVLLIQ